MCWGGLIWQHVVGQKVWGTVGLNWSASFGPLGILPKLRGWQVAVSMILLGPFKLSHSRCEGSRCFQFVYLEKKKTARAGRNADPWSESPKNEFIQCLDLCHVYVFMFMPSVPSQRRNHDYSPTSPRAEGGGGGPYLANVSVVGRVSVKFPCYMLLTGRGGGQPKKTNTPLHLDADPQNCDVLAYGHDIGVSKAIGEIICFRREGFPVTTGESIDAGSASSHLTI